MLMDIREEAILIILLGNCLLIRIPLRRKLGSIQYPRNMGRMQTMENRKRRIKIME